MNADVLGVVRRGDDRSHAAAHRELTGDGHAPRPAGGDEIVEDLVDDLLVEDAAIAELEKVVLERFQLETDLAGHVADFDLAEVGQSRHRTHRRELEHAMCDFVMPAGSRVRKRLDRRRAHERDSSIRP